MSDSASYPSASFSDAETADVRRFCGYPVYGVGTAGFVGDRFFAAWGQLEYKMVNLRPEEFQVARMYLANLYPLETAILGAAATLNVDQAGPFKRNAAELRERRCLFDDWRRRLCGFLGVPPGPALGDGGLRLVV